MRAPLSKRLLSHWAEKLPLYAYQGLFVLDKADVVKPLVFNPMQWVLHTALEEQKKEKGWVRAIILKARQMGCSTYTAARFFAQMHLDVKGARAYLLAHEDDAAVKITRIYHRFWEFHQQNLRRPRSRASGHELAFEHGGGLESSTASTPSGGRGGTVRLYHGSEVAFWTHAGAHATGSMQQMSTGEGTEMVLESTANGPAGSFYERWRQANAGRGDFMPLFFPWTVDPMYQREPEGIWIPSVDAPNEVVPSEQEYEEEHTLTQRQMFWRRMKIEELGADGEDGALKFSQEYPITAEEAFLGVSGNSLLSPAQVEAARRRPTYIDSLDRMHPLVLGLDPAPGHSAESVSALAFRRGYKCYRMDTFRGQDARQVEEIVYRIFMEEGADRLCIDCSEGTGQSIYMGLIRRAGTAGKVIRVVFGGKSPDKSRWYNVRAYIYQKLANWVADGGAIIDELQTTGPTLATELLSVMRLPGNERVMQVEAKKDIIKRLGRSPDKADALACTFIIQDPDPDMGGVYVASADSSVRVQARPGDRTSAYNAPNAAGFHIAGR